MVSWIDWMLWVQQLFYVLNNLEMSRLTRKDVGSVPASACLNKIIMSRIMSWSSSSETYQISDNVCCSYLVRYVVTKAGMVYSVSGWTRGVQAKLWDPLRTRAIPERLRGVFTTRRYTNPRLPLPLLTLVNCYIFKPAQKRVNSLKYSSLFSDEILKMFWAKGGIASLPTLHPSTPSASRRFTQNSWLLHCIMNYEWRNI